MRWFCALVLLAACQGATERAHRQEVEAWHQERLARLRSPDGWLSLAGLFWLKPGVQQIGSHPGSEVLLPKGSAPPVVGDILLEEGKVSFTANPKLTVWTSHGERVTHVQMVTDLEEEPTILSAGRVSFYIIERGERLGVRVKDPEAPARKLFAGVERFDVQHDWAVTARFESYNPPRTLAISNVIGGVDEEPSWGAAIFERGGNEYRLESTGEDELFFVFADETNGKTTYGAGRFLVSELPKDGQVILDFNEAYNPPCAFTPYATCPLPPKENRLSLSIDAGEKTYRDPVNVH